MINYIKEHPIEVITFTVVIFSGFAVCYGIGYYAGLGVASIGTGIATADKATQVVTITDKVLTLADARLIDKGLTGAIKCLTKICDGNSKSGAEMLLDVSDANDLLEGCKILLDAATQ